MFFVLLTLTTNLFLFMLFFLKLHDVLCVLQSFPTRRSSDLWLKRFDRLEIKHTGIKVKFGKKTLSFVDLDRKSTRLNSRHVAMSYAVFCLKKKKKCANLYAPR